MDTEDRVLRELFAAEPPADDGFSDRVMRRIARREQARLRLRRWLLPAAVVAGCAVAAPTLGGALTGLGVWLRQAVGSMQAAGAALLPEPGAALGSAALAAAALLVFRLLED